MSKRTIPAISIVIPMYNAEKYVGECLDSILAQTFDDYEVIVVDDCSTDNSVKIVNNYLHKFTGGGRQLKLIRSKVNAGSGVSRNIGMHIAIGEYLMFVDSDDAITPTALEELYPIAENFKADVVHCEKHYRSLEPNITKNQSGLSVHSNEIVDFVKAPTLLSKSIADRMTEFGPHQIMRTPWNNLISREFIVRNNILFPENVRTAEDFVFSVHVLCLAETVVRAPNIVYIYRNVPNSASKPGNSVEQIIHRKVNDAIFGIDCLEKIMNRIEFFNANLEYKYMIFDVLTSLSAGGFLQLYAQIPAYKLDGLIRKEISKVEDKTALATFLFARMNIFNLNLLQNQQKVKQLQDRLQQSQSQTFHLNTEDIFK